MSFEPLARLLDPEALDRSPRPRGLLTIAVPRTWMRDGARFEVDLPERLRCDVCDGGGCDRCRLSGAYRLPGKRLPVAVTLPRVKDDRFAVRIANPVGDAEPSLLVVRIRGEATASPNVRWVGRHHEPTAALQTTPPVSGRNSLTTPRLSGPAAPPLPVSRPSALALALPRWPDPRVLLRSWTTLVSAPSLSAPSLSAPSWSRWWPWFAALLFILLVSMAARLL